MKLWLTLLFSIALAQASTGEIQELAIPELGGAKVRVWVPEGWKSAKGFHGIPLTLFGPEAAKGRRAVIQLVPNDPKKARLTVAPGQATAKDIQEAEAVYAQGKREWFRKRNITEFKFKPYQILDAGNGLKLHQMSVEYMLGHETLIEQSVYGQLGPHFVHIKALAPHGQDLQKVVATFCSYIASK